MYKKFLNAILFGALILGSAGTITSCKDYDDEIDEINQKLGTLSSKDELTSQISQLAGTISAAQTAASQAATEAANALAAAKDAAATAGQAVNTATSASGQSGEAFAAAKDAAAAAETAAVNTAAAAKSAASAAAEAKKAAESGAGSAASAEKAQAAATAAQAAAAEASKNAAAATDAAQASSKKAADAAASAAAAEGTAKEVQEAAAAAAAAQAALAQAAAADAKKAEASAQSAASEAASAAAQAADAAGNAKAAAASAADAQAASKAAAAAAEASKAAASAAAAQADAAKASAAAAEASAAAAQTDAADAKASAAASAAKADDAAKKAAAAAKSASDSAASAAAAQTDAAAAKKAATDSAKDAAAASTAANDAKNSADLAKAASEAAASSASDAADSAKKASENLQKALDSLEEVANAAAKKAAEDAKEAALKAIQSKLDDLQTEIDLKADGETTEAQIAEWRAELETMIAESAALIGHRLTDLAVIPTTHINGIAAITVKTLTYIPQVPFNALSEEELGKIADTYNGGRWYNHDENWEGLQGGSYHSYYRPILDHIALGWDAEDEDDFVAPVFISSEKNEAYYHVAPSNGVRTQDIKLPLFDNIVSENLITRADYDDENIPVVVNEPLEPTSYEINNNVLRVTFKKTTTDMLNPITEPEELYGQEVAKRMSDNGFDFGRRGRKEFFYMVSLKAPIADENLLPEETEAFVNSEYTRVQEDVLVPYIAHKKADFTKPLSYDMFADETQVTENEQAQAIGDRLFVHYHDSVCIYNSEYDEYIDIKAEYNKKLDLKEWVTVCTTDNFWSDHSNHEELADYADYGLGFRFYLAEAPYITLGGPDDNTLKTDQQKFAKVSVDGIMESKVYTIDGVNQTSVGREPIVRVELWDEVNDNLIAIRYIKVQWVKSIAVTPIEYVFDNALFACGPFESIIGTEEMNTKIYAQVQEGGMPKETFHITYPDPENMEFTEGSENYGRVFLLRNNQGQVESYNILWTIAHTDIVKMIIKEYKGSWDLWFASGKPLEFTKTFKWKSPVAATLEITLKRNIYPEDFKIWGYDGRYWRGEKVYEVFNINPVVFNTQEPNPAWNVPTNVSWDTPTNMNNPTNNIYTDLLNGFIDDMGKKPTTGADGVLYYVTPVKASNRQYDNGVRFEYTYELGKKYYYASDYENVATGFRGVSRATDIYSYFNKEGVRFIYDLEKLNTGKYVYEYYDTTTGTYKEGYAKVVDNDGKEPKLYIVPNKNVDPADQYLAATIVNYEPNLVARPNVTQPELTYNIKLQEAAPEHDPYSGDEPTEAAKALVNQYVPLMMVANICEDNFKEDPEGGEYAHFATIKKYDAFIIEPLKPKTAKADDFTDAVENGSTINVQGVNFYQSWNADEKRNYYPVMNGQIEEVDGQIEDLTVNAQGKLEGGSDARRAASQYIYDEYVKMGYSSTQALRIANLAFRLGRFYETTPAEWDTENVTTNLAIDADGNLVPTEGVTTGPLPSNTEVVYDAETETLTYHNYNGTPVNWNYKMYIPVRFGYKWNTQVNYVEVNVISNQGTDDHQD